jgi:hypothetical protein
MMRKIVILLSVLALSATAYDLGGRSTSTPTAVSGPEAPAFTGILDPSRLTVNHAVSFHAGGSQISDMKSQSVYSTMFQYRFNAPVVLRLNFDMPIHSTFNPYNNFTTDNLSSMEYFKNMPFDASIVWQPTQNFMFRFSMIRMPESAHFHNSFYNPDRFLRGW